MIIWKCAIQGKVRLEEDVILESVSSWIKMEALYSRYQAKGQRNLFFYQSVYFLYISSSTVILSLE